MSENKYDGDLERVVVATKDDDDALTMLILEVVRVAVADENRRRDGENHMQTENST